MARKKRVVLPNRCYHLVSRVAHRAFFFDDEEKRRFVDFLMRVALFSGVKLLGWCVMSNHFHIFIYLPEATELTDDQLLERVNALYRGVQLQQAQDEWKTLKEEAEREEGGESRWRWTGEGESGSDATGVSRPSYGSRFEDLKARLRNRMFHPGEFMKTLKQYLTTSFNGRRVHCGTLWENRYKVRISKPLVKDMSRQLAYVDCNPCEAGLCGNPADYPWSGWHAAVGGDEAAREMYRFVYCGDGARFEGDESEMSWEDIVAVHEQAIRERLGEIADAKAAGEEVDWMFSVRADREKDAVGTEEESVSALPLGDEMPLPEGRAIQLERGKGETAERILAAVRAAGDMSAGEILEAVGISSRPLLLSAYLKPMVAKGFLVLTLPDKPSSRHQKYRVA